MFDIGWTEMLVIAVVMIVVVGPKDLPKMLRTFGRMTTKMRGMASDFQKQFNEALKEAELDEVKKSVDQLRDMNPASQVKKALNPFEKAAADVRSGIQSAMAPKPAATSTASASSAVAKPSEASEPAAATAHVAEPLKNGASALPEAAVNGATATAVASATVNGAASLASPPPALTPAPPPAAAAPATESKAVRAAPRKRAAPAAPAQTPPAQTAPAKTAKTTIKKAEPSPGKPPARRAATGGSKATGKNQ